MKKTKGVNHSFLLVIRKNPGIYHLRYLKKEPLSDMDFIKLLFVGKKNHLND